MKYYNIIRVKVVKKFYRFMYCSENSAAILPQYEGFYLKGVEC